VIEAAKNALRPAFRAVGLDRARQRVRNSRWYFDRVLDRYLESHSTVWPSHPDDANLATLVADGILVLPEYHDRNLIRSLHDRLLPTMERVRQGQADPAWNTLVYKEDGIYRLQDLGTTLPEASAVLADAYLASLATDYLGGMIRATRDYVDYKPDLVHDHTTQLHMDSWQSQVKIFTLLCDVDEARAPLAYWAGSHRDGPWRRRFDHFFWTGDELGVAGMVPAYVLRRLAEEDDRVREIIVTGKAGTVIIADTRGVHRASDLREGYRLEIVQKLTQPVVS
jgi:hypothetical protein